MPLRLLNDSTIGNDSFHDSAKFSAVLTHRVNNSLKLDSIQGKSCHLCSAVGENPRPKKKTYLAGSVKRFGSLDHYLHNCNIVRHPAV